MTGLATIGAYGIGDASPAVPTAFMASVTGASTATIFLVEVELYAAGDDESDGGGVGAQPIGTAPIGGEEAGTSATVVTVRLSDWPFITADSDTPASTWYEPACREPLEISRSIPMAPEARADGQHNGTIILDNESGQLDAYLDGYGFGGRLVRVLAGDPEAAREDFAVIFEGVVTTWEAETERVRLRVRDNAFGLDTPHISTTYAGTGGYEGPAGLKGRIKPKIYGRVFNAPMILLTTTPMPIWQVSDGAIEAVDALRDGGTALSNAGDVADLTATSVSAGTFKTDLTRGLLATNGLPNFQLRADVRGCSANGYVETAPAIAERLLIDRGVDDSQRESGSFAALAAGIDGIAGIRVDDDTTTRALLDQVLRGIGAHWYAGRDGLLRAGRLTVPDPAGWVVALDETLLIRVDRLQLPDTINPATWRRRVAFKTNQAPQAEDDLAASVSADDRIAYGNERLEVRATDGTVKTRHPTASDPAPLASPLYEEADAQAVADHLLALQSADRQVLALVLKSPGFALDLGQTVRVFWSALGLTAGRDMRIVGIRESCAERTVRLVVWG